MSGTVVGVYEVVCGVVGGLGCSKGMGHWHEPGGAAKEEGVHQWLAVVAVPREARVEGGADEREEKQREHGEDVAEPCVGAVGQDP